VFDWDEDSMALGVVELKILGNRPVGCLDLPGSHVSAEAMRGMEHQLTGIEGGSELRWQDFIIVPAPGASQTPRSGDICGGLPGCRARGAGAGHHYQGDRDQITRREPLTQEEKARRGSHRGLEAHQDAEDLPR
jgi:hypothetical protein